MDYYERTLVNHLLGEQDPGSAHGFVAYYTGLSPGAHKQVPANYFRGADENVFATDYDTFTCDTATGLEIPTRFTDTIYTRDPDGALRVNLFISSRVRAGGLEFRQAATIPDAAATTLAVEAGAGWLTLRVRVPAWASSVRATLNGRPQSLSAVAGPASVEIARAWRPGDELLISFGMRLAVQRAPDDPRVAAVVYGPVVLAGLTGGDDRMPALDVSSIRQVSASPLSFEALLTPPGPSSGPGGGARLVSLIPVSSVVHQRYTTYWQVR
jgi:DUF1680 family protein